MFKGIINISLAILFLFTSSGVILNKHYCCDKFVSASLYSTPQSCCGGHCNKCHNETTVFKITDNYQNSNLTVDLTQQIKEIIAPVSFFIISYIEPTIFNKYFSDTSSPPGSKIPSLLQVFRL